MGGLVRACLMLQEGFAERHPSSAVRAATTRAAVIPSLRLPWYSSCTSPIVGALFDLAITVSILSRGPAGPQNGSPKPYVGAFFS